MNQADTIEMRTELFFTHNSNSSNEEIKIEKGKNITPDGKHKAGIDNYLKTPEEMEADFILEADDTQSLLSELNDTLKKYEPLFRQRDNDTLSSGTLYHGFMEENY